MSFTLVTLSGTFLVSDDLSPARGVVTFRLSHPMQDTGNNQIVSADRRSVRLDATGSFSISLPANDDPTTQPTGVTYEVEELVEDSPRRSYAITLLRTQPSVNLADLAPAVPAPQLFSYALVGHTHPGGSGDLNVVITFGVPTTPWPLPHNMGKFPSIEIVDSTNRVVGCQVDHIDVNNAVATPAGAMAGKAVCN